MDKTKLFLNGTFILILLCSALGTFSSPARADDNDSRVDPNLLQLANDHPDFVFPIIVQRELKNKDLPDDEPEFAVEKANGKVNREKKMEFIASFSADLTGKEIEKLSKNPKVRWISLDAPLFSTALPGFGTSGKVSTAIGNGDDEIRAMAVQSDGKIVVAGITSNGANNDFAVARYNTDGSLDTAFDGDGKFTRGWGFGHDEANAVAIQADGKIIVAGTSYNGTAFLYTLLRLNPNGSLDTTFDSDGIVTTAVNTKNNDIIQSIAIQSDGKIVAAGQSYNGSNTDFSLVRYNSNGSLDVGFGSSGKVITAFGTSHDYIYSIAIQPTDGKIVAAGTSYNGTKYNFALARYTNSGTLDTTFGSKGKVTTSMTTATDRAYGMVLQPDGKILVAGESNFDFGLARYTSNGSLDTSFGSAGKVTTPMGAGMDFGRSVELQSDGKVLVAGYGSNGSNNDFAVARYTSNGALDTTFDGDGKVTTAIGAGQDIGYSLKVQFDGKILVGGGSTGSNNDFAMVRYNSDGGLDCSQCIDTGKLTNAYIRAVGADRLWNAPGYLQGQGITVAVVDSGINPHADLQVATGNSRIVASTNVITTITTDDYGHGSHVAGVIGGNGNANSGVRIGMAPAVNLINVKVSDSTGMSLGSDLVAGLQWVYDNRLTYNIRVVNISMNSTAAESYNTSPIDAAVEILWFNGIVVVVSAGNNGGPSTIYPPANDPFVITVGAADDMGTPSLADDAVATFSAYGTTENSFAKPDLVAPGRNIISLNASTNSNIYNNHSPNRVDNNYFRMSGTSMAAPVVTGAVALLLQDEPNLNPDQVKYRLMATANKGWTGYSATMAGAGYLDVYAAVTGTSTQSANTGILASQMLSTGSTPITWSSVGWNSVGWNSVGWNSVGWNSVGWNSVGWNSVGWNSDYWDP